jgi:hypothetical protein
MGKFKEEELRPFEIQPLNEDVLGNLSIEELEERLEMQILHVSEAQWCLIDTCGADCGSNCQVNCGGNCGANCGSNCVGNCPGNCVGDCSPLCGVDGCGTDCAGDGGCFKDFVVVQPV